MKKIILPLLVFGVFFAGCSPKPQAPGTTDTTTLLASWNDTQTKKAIVDFVKNVTDSASPGFVPKEYRVAVFDNDGTLWCEQPLYTEFVFSLDVMKDILNKKPELQKKPELKALAEGDMATFMKSGELGMIEAFAISHTAMPVDQFDRTARAWLDTATHKRFSKKFTELTYKPMVELLDYLRANDFTTYIVSGGSAMFIRVFGEDAYGIPTGQVVGTLFKARFVAADKSVTLLPEVFHNDDNVGKPAGIYQFIGRKPILAFGNSDGDLEMLQWTATNTLPNLELILRHTDAEREYAYDRASSIGKLDKALDEANSRGWVVVDMKADFAKVFSYE